MPRKPRLVDDWRAAWRWFSVHIATAAIAWGALPADTQATLLATVGIPESRVPALLGLLFLIARLVQQPGPGGGESKP